MYKFIKKKYSQQLLLEGNIKIGTLYSYRDSELEKGISDLNEGIKTVSYQFSENAVIGGNHNNPDNKDYIASSQFGVAYADETSLIHLGNAQTSKVIESENFFILCLSREQDAQFEDANYDSCIYITNDNFFKELTELINEQIPVNFLGYYEIIYQDKNEEWNGKDMGLHPCIIKDNKEEYVKQKEVRAIWEPKDDKIEIEPIYISNKKLCRYLKEISL